MRPIFCERAKSIAGGALVAVGMFILYEHVDRAAIQLNHLLASPGGALGALPSVIFAASRFVQSYAADDQRFLQNFVKQILMSAWPLLLVMVGTVLSRDGFRDERTALQKKDSGLVDLTGGRSTLK